MTETVQLKEIEAEQAARRVREVIAADGVVAFPTETVYGLAVQGDSPDAVEALFRLKERDRGKPLARYVDSAEAVRKIEGRLRLRFEKLAAAFWPGPLTIVLERDDDSTEGYRCSSHPVAHLMGNDPELVVSGTSANLSGDPPLTTAEQIAQTFGDRLALVVDHGEALTGAASTVILLPAAGGYRLLREGDLAEAVVRAELATRILFVCTGNTCRSPMAAAMMRRLLDERDLAGAADGEVEVLSVGLSAFHGDSASANARAVASARGLDLGRHAARHVDRRTLEQVDRIYTMTGAHRDMILAEHPELAWKTRPLAGKDRDIADPFGGDVDTYENCAAEIEVALKSVMEEL